MSKKKEHSCDYYKDCIVESEQYCKYCARNYNNFEIKDNYRKRRDNP